MPLGKFAQSWCTLGGIVCGNIHIMGNETRPDGEREADAALELVPAKVGRFHVHENSDGRHGVNDPRSVSVKTNGRGMTVLYELDDFEQPPCTCLPYIFLVLVVTITSIGSTALAMHMMQNTPTFQNVDVCHAWCDQSVKGPPVNVSVHQPKRPVKGRLGRIP